jgi:hypothetical protein
MGETRNQALRAARPEDGVGLYFRSHLSRRRKRRRTCPALVQQRGLALHLEEISLAVAPHSSRQAGWHVSKKLPVPGNMTLVPLPPKEYVLPIRIDDTELDGMLPTISYVPIAMGVERIGNLLIQKLQL